MTLYHVRLLRVLLVLCVAVALAACDGGPAPVPQVATQSPMAPATDTPAAELPSPARTSEAQQPATPTSAFTTTAMATLTSTPTATSTLTATPTPALHVTAVPSPATSRCAGLVGGLEIQVLVGPAEAVGLEPVAVGSVPFAVTASAPPYLVEGQAPISYEDILVQEWGTYAVTMDLDMAVQGECSGESGSEQLVVVDAPRFHGEYPWSGTQSLNLAFPLEEGATAQGEGWTVVLHLGSP